MHLVDNGLGTKIENGRIPKTGNLKLKKKRKLKANNLSKLLY